MRNLKYIATIMVLLSVSCSDLYDEINTSPNDELTANPDELFTNAVVKGVSSYLSDVYLQQWGISTWIMHLAPLGGVESGKEYLMPTGKDSFWSEQYTLGLKNANEVVLLTQDDSQLVNKMAIAEIWKSFMFLRLSDLWGAIPYSDALKGTEALVLMPAYDTQEKVYISLLSVLKTASEQLDESKPSFGAADPIYQGDVAKWQRFANSLRFRMAIRIKEVAPELAEENIKELEYLPLIESNEDGAVFPYNWDFKNPLGEIFESGQDNGRNHPSKFLVDYLKQTNDPRIGIYAEPTPFSQLIYVFDYVGIPNLVPAGDDFWNGLTGDNAIYKSTIGNYFTNVENPGLLLTHAEVNFLKAEAALEGWISGSAKDYLEAAIRSEFSRLELSLTENQISSYLNALPELSLELIIQQKWLAFAYGNSYEAYADYRRTGFPVLLDNLGTPIDADQVPKRLTYPDSEVSLNYENYLEAIKIQGADDSDTELWWDIN